MDIENKRRIKPGKYFQPLLKAEGLDVTFVHKSLESKVGGVSYWVHLNMNLAKMGNTLQLKELMIGDIKHIVSKETADDVIVSKETVDDVIEKRQIERFICSRLYEGIMFPFHTSLPTAVRVLLNA